MRAWQQGLRAEDRGPGTCWGRGSQCSTASCSEASRLSLRIPQQGRVPRVQFTLSCSPCDAHAITALGSGHSPLSPTLQSLLSPGRSWETPARCPEKGVDMDSRAGVQMSRFSLHCAHPSSQAPAGEESDQWLRKPLAAAQPMHLSGSGRGLAPSFSFSWHLRFPAPDTSPCFCGGSTEMVMPCAL